MIENVDTKRGEVIVLVHKDQACADNPPTQETDPIDANFMCQAYRIRLAMDFTGSADGSKTVQENIDSVAFAALLAFEGAQGLPAFNEGWTLE
ncbi:MAG: hypothetical protein JRJ68_03230 [Deltaproteobacteria bacterium]|nr:hypothetical protein [Deltaproteobacteria bacterium]